MAKKKIKNDKITQQQIVDVVLITDDNYIIPTTVTIQSLVNNTSLTIMYNVHVICNNVSAKNKKILEDCCADKKNVKILTINADLNDLQNLHDSKNTNFMVATPTALLKFNIAEIFKNKDKILYLDGDLLVNCDVAKIFRTNLNNNYVAAVRDLPQVLFDKPDFGEDENYFNSGVMLLNLKKMREDNIRDLLIQTKKESYNDKLMDQNVFNKVFRFKVLQLHFKYNLPYCLFSTLRNFNYYKLSKYYDVNIRNIEDLKDYDSIVHFSSYLKPWIFNDSPYSTEWYKVFLNSPAKDLPLTRVSSVGHDLNSFKKLKQVLINKNKFDASGKSISEPYPIQSKYDISIIIPCYNQENNIEKCLDSVLNQTLNNIEIIAVNDGSTDNTVKLLKKIQTKNKNLKIIDLEHNEGTSNARKKGVLASLGKYVMFLDADDALELTACETLYNAMEEKQTDILQFGVNVIDQGVKPETLEWFKWFVRPFTGYLVDDEIFFACHEQSKINYLLWNKIYNGNLARKAFSHVQDGYFLMGEDLYVHAMMLFFAKTYTGIEDQLYIYNYGGGLTGKGEITLDKFKKISPQTKIIELLYKFIDENQFSHCQRYFKAISKINENFLTNVCSNYLKTEESVKDECFKTLLSNLVPSKNITDYINEEVYIEAFNSFLKNIDTLFYAKYPRRMQLIYSFLKDYMEKNNLIENKDARYVGRLYNEIIENKEFDKIDQSEIIPVVFATNMNYAHCTGVAIQSLIENSAPNKFYDIYVLHSDINEYTQQLIKNVATSNVRISFLNLANKVKNLGLYTNFHISIETYFRFFIPELIYRYDKVLYLDCDIVINDDISKLYEIDLSDYPLGAVQNQLVKQTTIDYIKNTLKINPNDYFNAGVLLINCRKFDELNIQYRAFNELKNRKLMLMDQDALNVVCKNNYLKIEGKWNFQVGCDKYSISDKYNANVGIYHYTSGNKPWNSKNLPLSELFWKYARKTSFYESIILTYIEKTLKINDLKVVDSANTVGQSNKGNKKKKSKFQPFKYTRKFFKSLKKDGFRFTMHLVKNKIKSAFKKMFGKNTKNNNQRYATQTIYYDYYKSLSPKYYKKELQNWFNKKMNDNMDIDNPKTFNQKIQWLKLYDSTLIKSHLTDKWLAKEFVKAKLGDEYIIKTLGVFDKFEDINFDKLPNQFVIKSTHGSGQIEIVRDKTKLNIDQLKKKVNGWLKLNYAYNLGLELHYANIIPRIIVEEYMSGINDDLYDYKIVCNNGKVDLIWVDTNRFTGHRRNLYDTNWQLMPVLLEWPNSDKPVEKPKQLDKLIEISNKIAKQFAHVRCDFYILVDGSIKFGEFTFTSGSGVDKFNPYSFDQELGEKLILPEKTKFKKLSRKQIAKAEQKFLKHIRNK